MHAVQFEIEQTRHTPHRTGCSLLLLRATGMRIGVDDAAASEAADAQGGGRRASNLAIP